jgi:hypothetical protein
VVIGHGGPGATHDYVAPIAEQRHHIKEPERSLAVVQGFLERSEG